MMPRPSTNSPGASHRTPASARTLKISRAVYKYDDQNLRVRNSFDPHIFRICIRRMGSKRQGVGHENPSPGVCCSPRITRDRGSRSTSRNKCRFRSVYLFRPGGASIVQRAPGAFLTSPRATLSTPTRCASHLAACRADRPRACAPILPSANFQPARVARECP